MGEKISNAAFAEFVRQNREKIEKSTPYNPSIKKNDEWLKESEWDEYVLSMKARYSFGDE